MRTIPANAVLEIAKKTGTEPLIIVEIDWTDVITGKYCDSDDYNGIDDRLLDYGDIDFGTKISGSGTSGQITITLDDSDGALKTIIDTDNPYLRPVRVYQGFRDLLETEKFLIFEGQINSPVQWSESDRKLSLTVVTTIEDGQYGFTPEEGDFECIDPKFVGKSWPLCYGRPIRVPAVQIAEAPNGKVATPYRLITYTDLRNLHKLIDEFDVAEADRVFAESFDLTKDNYKNTYDNAVRVESEKLKALTDALVKLELDEPLKEPNLSLYPDDYRAYRDAKREVAKLKGRRLEIDNLNENAALQIAQIQKDIDRENADPNTDANVIAALTANKNNEQNEINTRTAEKTNITNVTLPAAEALVVTETDDLRIRTRDLIEADFITILVDDADCFPQSPTVTNVVVKNVVLAGIFAGARFLRTSGFNRLYNNITFDVRQNSNPNEFWINSNLSLKGMYCLINRTGTPSYSVVYIKDQQGNRCFFEPPLFSPDTVDPEKTVPFLPDGLNGLIDEVCGTVLPDWLNNVFTEDEELTGYANLPKVDWELKPGDVIRVNTTFDTKFVANCIPSLAISEVLAYRTTKDDVKRLTNVPTDYFVFDLDEPIAGADRTTITLERPLSFYSDEGWEDQLYVTLESSVGPNTADIIDDLLTRYGNSGITFNAASKAALSTALAKYPMDFYRADNGHIFDLIDKLCWQARCGAFIEAGEVFVKYLSAEEAPVQTLDTNIIKLRSLEVSHNKTESLVTWGEAKWRLEHAQLYGKDDELDRFVTIRNNIPSYGEFKKEYDIFAFNFESGVSKTLLFWMIRYSMIWNYLVIKCHLDTLRLQVYDTVQITTPTYTGLAVVQKVQYGIKSNEVTYTLWTPQRAGESVEYSAAWPSTSTGDWPTINDPEALIGDSQGNP